MSVYRWGATSVRGEFKLPRQIANIGRHQDDDDDAYNDEIDYYYGLCGLRPLDSNSAYWAQIRSADPLKILGAFGLLYIQA